MDPASADAAAPSLALLRPRRCRYGCEDIVLFHPGHPETTVDAVSFADHERFQCPGRVLPCVNGCGKRVRSDAMTQHTSPWGGDCLQRFVRCPSNFVGWRIRVTGDELLGLLKRSLDAASKSEFAFVSLVASTAAKAKAPRKKAPGAPPSLSTSISSLSQHASRAPPPGHAQQAPTAGVGIVLKYERTLPENPSSRADPVRVTGAAPRLSVDHVDEAERDFLLVRFGTRHMWINVWSTPFTLLEKAAEADVVVVGGVVPKKRNDPDAVAAAAAASAAAKHDAFECGWVVKADLFLQLQTRCCNRSVWLGGDDTVRAHVARAEDDSDDEASTVLSVSSLGHQPKLSHTRAARAATRLSRATAALEGNDDDDNASASALKWVEGGGGGGGGRGGGSRGGSLAQSVAHQGGSAASVYSDALSSVSMDPRGVGGRKGAPVVLPETAGDYRAADLGDSLESERQLVMARPLHQRRFLPPGEGDLGSGPHPRAAEDSLRLHTSTVTGTAGDRDRGQRDDLSEVSMQDLDPAAALLPGQRGGGGGIFRGQRSKFKHSLTAARQRVAFNYFSQYEKALVLCGLCVDTADADELDGVDSEEMRLKRQQAQEALAFFNGRPPSGVRRGNQDTSLNRLRCVYGCGEQLVATDMAEHMAYKVCDALAFALSDICLNTHIVVVVVVVVVVAGAVCVQCGRRPVVCPQCGDGDDGYLWADELDQHLALVCSHRTVGCPLMCEGEQMAPVMVFTNVLPAAAAAEEVAHSPSRGGARSLLPPNLQGKKKRAGGDARLGCAMPAAEVERHMAHHCPRRIVPCSHVGCPVTFEFQLRMYHENGDCQYKLVLCPQECGGSFYKWDLDSHMQFACPNKSRHYENHAPCPFNCGAVVRNKHMLEHLSYFCPRRLVECPDQCGVSVRLHKIKFHMIYCPNRKLCCDHETQSCRKPMKMWFYREYGPANGGRGRGGGGGGGGRLGTAGTAASDDDDDDDEGGAKDGASLWRLDEDDDEEEEDRGSAADGDTNAEDLDTASLPSGPLPPNSYRDNIKKGLKYVREQRRQIELVPHVKQFQTRQLRPSEVESADSVSTHSSLTEQGVLSRGLRQMYRKGKGQWRPATAGSRLRMTKCKQHGMTALMAAIRLPPYEDPTDHAVDGAGAGEAGGAVASANKTSSPPPAAHADAMAIVPVAEHKSDGGESASQAHSQSVVTASDDGPSASRKKGDQGDKGDKGQADPAAVALPVFPEPEDDGEDQVALMDFILKQTGGTDIDAENDTGDTALMIACRYGKYKLVELLVQRGAEVNLETSKGKTALIETVKARVQSMRILLYLLDQGAKVEHRSARCRIGATDWARNMRRAPFTRALELARTVQANVLQIFRSVACGDDAAVERLLDFSTTAPEAPTRGGKKGKGAVEEKKRKPIGMKFDPLLPAKIQEEMERFLIVAKECEKDAKQMDRDIDQEIQAAVAEQKKVVRERTVAAYLSAVALDDALKKKRAMDSRMTGSYVLFERNVLEINIADLEVRPPLSLVRPIHS